MKLIGVLFAILAVSSVAMAQPADPCLGLPDNATEVEVWEWVAGAWVPIILCDPCAKARLFASGGLDCYCNRREWVIPVEIHASIAQWVDFYVTGTRWDWRVLKPGTYGGDCITFEVCSNGEVCIDYEGFDDLYSPTSCTPYIPTWYAYGQQIETVEWIRAIDLNIDDDCIPEVCPGHCWQTKLWTRVEIQECHTACEYHDDAVITLTLVNQKPWVDDDGSWCDKDPCPFWGCD